MLRHKTLGLHWRRRRGRQTGTQSLEKEWAGRSNGDFFFFFYSSPKAMSECHRKRVLSSERKGGVPALSLCGPRFHDDDELCLSLMVHSSPGASAKCLSEGGGFCFFCSFESNKRTSDKGGDGIVHCGLIRFSAITMQS